MAETVLSLNERSTDNLSSIEKIQMEENSSEGLVLKELPKHLKYAFLGEERSNAMILAADLTIEKEHKVIETLKKHQDAIASSVEDLKGISHQFVCIKSLWRGMQRLKLNIREG